MAMDKLWALFREYKRLFVDIRSLCHREKFDEAHTVALSFAKEIIHIRFGSTAEVMKTLLTALRTSDERSFVFANDLCDAFKRRNFQNFYKHWLSNFAPVVCHANPFFYNELM